MAEFNNYIKLFETVLKQADDEKDIGRAMEIIESFWDSMNSDVKFDNEISLESYSENYCNLYCHDDEDGKLKIIIYVLLSIRYELNELKKVVKSMEEILLKYDSKSR